MKENEYQVVQAIAGRTRIRIPWLKTNEEATGKLQRLIESLHYVTSVRVNPLAQSLIVLYRASAVSPAELEAQVADAIHQANPVSPLSASPVPAPAIASPLPVAPPTPVEVEPAAQSSPTQPAVNSPAAVIPSPWDEPSEPEPVAETHAESQPAVSESASQPEPEGAKPAPTISRADVIEPEKATLQMHSTTSLAKRLNTTSQAITHRRNRPDFPTWTQSQDPERIAWKYDAASQSFGPADAPAVNGTAAPASIVPEDSEKPAESLVVETPQPPPAASPSPKSTTQKRKSTQSGKRRSTTKRAK